MAANQTWVAEVEWTAGVWTDITAYVDTARFPFDVTGGDTPEASANPGSTALPLKNSDQRFTPLNVLSPNYPNIVPGKRCRIRDIIADQVVDLFTGYLQFPQIDSWVGGNADAPRDQIINVPFVDLVAFVADSRILHAALTEQILFQGGSDLKALWPLTNELAPFNGIGPVTAPMTVTRSSAGSVPPNAVATPKGGEAPVAAESNGLRCNRIFDAATGGESYNMVAAPETFAPAIADTGESVTAVFWMSHQEVSAQSFQQLAVLNILGSSSITIELLRDQTTGAWSLTASGAQSATINAGPVGLDALLPIGIRYCPSPANMELWIGSHRMTATPTGSAPTGMTLSGSPVFGFQFGAYDLSTVQVYIGPTWGWTDYLELTRQASAPLDRQLTGDRIRRALAYAGIDLPTYRIDPGVAVMSAVTTSGRRASDLIGEAVETELGEYWAAGDGIPVFADRQRIYNV